MPIFIQYIHPFSKFRIFIALGIFIADALLSTFVPQMAKQMLMPTYHTYILWPVIWFASLKFLTHSTQFLTDITLFPLVNNTIRNLQIELSQKWHKQELHIKEAEFISYIKRIGYSIRILFRQCILNLLPTVYKFIITAFVFYKLQLLSFNLLLIGLLWCGIFYYFQKYYLKLRAEAWKTTDQTTLKMFENLEQKNLYKTFKQSFDFYLSKQFNKEALLWQKNNTMKNLLFIGREIIVLFITIAIFYITLHKINTGQLTQSDFILIQTQLMSFLVPFRNLISGSIYISESLIDLKKILHILKIKNSDIPHNESKVIICKNLDFSYPNQRVVFKNLNLKIYPHEKILVKGKSGVGKSTFVKIIANSLLPSNGFLSTPSHIFLIEQEPKLMHETVEFHLTLGSSQIAEEEMKKALKLVDLEHFKLNRLVSHELSSGEKCRLLIAKAILQKPNVLILDETTSFLPPDLENTILEELSQTIETLIVIGHHLETIPNQTTKIIIEQNQIKKYQSPTPQALPLRITSQTM